MITMVPVLILVLFLGGCAAKANLRPPASSCSATQLATAAAATVYSHGVVVLDAGGAAAHTHGTWSLPGVMRYDAIADRVDATEDRHE